MLCDNGRQDVENAYEELSENFDALLDYNNHLLVE